MNSCTTIEKINSIFPELKVIEILNYKVVVKDQYGLCEVFKHELLNGSKPSIITAINKTEYFKNKLKQIQPNLFVIEQYRGSHTPIKIRDTYGICNAVPCKLLRGVIPSIEIAEDKTKYWINRAKEVHGDCYNYSEVNYINSSTKINIICNSCKTKFSQRPTAHLQGRHCLNCKNKDKGGWWYKNKNNLQKITNMYIFELTGNGEKFLKLGVSVNIKNRIAAIKHASKQIYTIKVLKHITNTVEYCYKLEKRFKRKIKHKSYIPKIPFGGMYECFK